MHSFIHIVLRVTCSMSTSSGAKEASLALIPQQVQVQTLDDIGISRYVKVPPRENQPQRCGNLRRSLTTPPAEQCNPCPFDRLEARSFIACRTCTLPSVDRVVGQPMKRTRTSAFGTNGRVGHDASQFYGQRLYQDFDIRKKPTTSGDYNTPNQLDVIHCADSRDMHHLPSDSVHLMITSPPYNVGKEYDADLTLKEYIDLLSNVISEVYRVLVEGGRACINIANVGRTPYITLALIT